MKAITFLFAVIFALAVNSSAQTPKIGAAIDAFSMNDTSGKTRSLDSLKGQNGTLIVFLSAQCPVVRGYKDRINEVAADLSKKGINVVGINSNATESLDWVKSNAAEFGYKFPVLIDKGAVLADRLGATVTPEVYYLDAGNILLYHGAIDNDRSGRNVTEQYLRTAVDSTLSGKKIERPSANAFGCSIKRSSDQ